MKCHIAQGDRLSVIRIRLSRIYTVQGCRKELNMKGCVRTDLTKQLEKCPPRISISIRFFTRKCGYNSHEKNPPRIKYQCTNV
jgi:hypothetical protein